MIGGHVTPPSRAALQGEIRAMDTATFNDIGAVVEADRTHVWHHLTQHKPFETVDPRVIVECKGAKGGLRDRVLAVQEVALRPRSTSASTAQACP